MDNLKISVYLYISCYKNLFSPLFYAKINFLHLFLQYVLQLHSLVQKLHLLFMKVGSHFYGRLPVYFVFIKHFLCVFFM